MALNFNIPMPGLPGSGLLQGMQAGGNLFQQFMHPKLEREKQAQLERHFQEQLKLSKAAAGRAASAAMDAHRLAKQKLDPTYEARQMEAVMDYFRNKNKAAGQAFGVPGAGNQQFPQENIPMPTEEAGQGLGQREQDVNAMQQAQAQQAQSMPGEEQTMPGEDQVMQQPQQQANLPGNPSSADLDLMRKFPALRGLYKKHFKIDPLAEEEKALHGPARDAADLEKLRKSAGENSPVYQNAKADYDARSQQHADLSTIRNRQITGLKPGDTEIKNPETGQVEGFRKQTTEKQKEAAKNKVLFNHFAPLIFKVSDKLTGPGATETLYNAAKTYKTNPESKKLVDDALIAIKAAANTTVSESARFQAGRTNQTYNRFAETLKSNDIPKKLMKWIQEFDIPGEANKKAGEKWIKLLNEAEKNANKQIPATYDYYFDPEKQFAHQQEKYSGNHNKQEVSEETQKLNGKTYKKINGEWHEVL